MGQFAVDLAAFAQKATDNANLVISKVTIDMLGKIILRSPVGNKELWAANKYALGQRKNYNIAVDALNARTLADPGNLNKNGKLRKGVKSYLLKRASARALAKAYPLPAGKSYSGGQFRANWQLTIGQAASGSLAAVDAQGQATIAKGAATLVSFEAGPAIFITNNLPYGHRLEYESWSKQAPSGMVRITVAEYASLIAKAVGELPQ